MTSLYFCLISQYCFCESALICMFEHTKCLLTADPISYAALLSCSVGSWVGKAYLTASEKHQLAPPQFLGHIAAQHIEISRLTHKDRAVDCCGANTHLVLRSPSLSIFYKFVLQPVEPALNLSEARDAVSAALDWTCKAASILFVSGAASPVRVEVFALSIADQFAKLGLSGVDCCRSFDTRSLL